MAAWGLELGKAQCERKWTGRGGQFLPIYADLIIGLSLITARFASIWVTVICHVSLVKNM